MTAGAGATHGGGVRAGGRTWCPAPLRAWGEGTRPQGNRASDSWTDALCAGDVTGANTAASPHRFQVATKVGFEAVGKRVVRRSYSARVTTLPCAGSSSRWSRPSAIRHQRAGDVAGERDTHRLALARRLEPGGERGALAGARKDRGQPLARRRRQIGDGGVERMHLVVEQDDVGAAGQLPPGLGAPSPRSERSSRAPEPAARITVVPRGPRRRAGTSRWRIPAVRSSTAVSRVVAGRGGIPGGRAQGGPSARRGRGPGAG